MVRQRGYWLVCGGGSVAWVMAGRRQRRIASCSPCLVLRTTSLSTYEAPSTSDCAAVSCRNMAASKAFFPSRLWTKSTHIIDLSISRAWGHESIPARRIASSSQVLLQSAREGSRCVTTCDNIVNQSTIGTGVSMSVDFCSLIKALL